MEMFFCFVFKFRSKFKSAAGKKAFYPQPVGLSEGYRLIIASQTCDSHIAVSHTTDWAGPFLQQAALREHKLTKWTKCLVLSILFKSMEVT